jgi:hypothetical protein
MTSILTFAVTSLRISNDIPIQSDYLPLITTYFLMSIVYTLTGLVWFVLLENFTKKKKLPWILLRITTSVNKMMIYMRRLIKDHKKINPKLEKSESNKNSSLSNQHLESNKREEKIENDDIEPNIKILNYMSFFALLSIICTCNLYIWLKISS